MTLHLGKTRQRALVPFLFGLLLAPGASASEATSEPSSLPSSLPVLAGELQRLLDDNNRLREQIEQAEARAREWATIEQEQTSAPVLESKSVDALYDDLVDRTERARNELATNLAAPPLEPPPFILKDAVRQSSEPKAADIRKQLDAALRERSMLTTGLQAALHQERRWHLAALADRTMRLNDQRIALLPKLSLEKRNAVLGFGDEGLAQAKRELRHLVLVTRWFAATEVPTLREEVRGLSGSTIALLLAQTGAALLLLALSRAITRRGAAALVLLAQKAASFVRKRSRLRLTFGVLHALTAIWPESVALTTLVLLAQLIASWLTVPAIKLIYMVAFDYVLYRLGIRVVYGAISWLSERLWRGFSTTIKLKLWRSVVMVARVAFAIHIYSVLSELVLGRGYLYALASRIGWLIALPLTVQLVRWWREDFADAYLSTRKEGRLRGVVEQSRVRWYGFFVAIAAFVVLLLETLFRAVKGFALSFDQSRKALAYIFRRRLEKKVSDALPSSPLALPQSLHVAFDTPAGLDETLLSSPPDLSTFFAAFDTWKRDRALGTWLIEGRRGVGKTTFVQRAARGRPSVYLRLDRRITSESELYRTLARQPDGVVVDEQTATAELERLSGTLFIVDGLEQLFLRRVGQRTIWEALFRLMAATEKDVFWLCTMRQPAASMLAWTEGALPAFRHVEALQPWDEEQIAALMTHRLAAASCRANYEGLLADEAADEAQTALVSTAKEYARLVWDYVDGSAEAALWFWKRSLSPGHEQGTLTVSLFSHPPETGLDTLSESERLLIVAAVIHAGLTLEDAVMATRLSRQACSDCLEAMRGRGILVRTNDRFSIPTEWWPVADRYVRRQHFVHD